MCRRVFVGLREAGSEQGVGDKGVVPSSPEAIAKMKALLHDLNVIIEHEYDIPSV